MVLLEKNEFNESVHSPFLLVIMSSVNANF
jgi:hypothetical protein